jgi:hypothetical protein
MQDYIAIEFIDRDEFKPFVLTYAIHRELQEYLTQESKLFEMFTDIEVANTVVSMCLSDRNDLGQVVRTFTEFNVIEASSAVDLLDFVFQYFSEFFLKHTKMVETLANKMRSSQEASDS